MLDTRMRNFGRPGLVGPQSHDRSCKQTCLTVLMRYPAIAICYKFLIIFAIIYFVFTSMFIGNVQISKQRSTSKFIRDGSHDSMPDDRAKENEDTVRILTDDMKRKLLQPFQLKKENYQHRQHNPFSLCPEANETQYFNQDTSLVKYPWLYTSLLSVRQDYCPTDTFLLILVSSHHSHVKERDVIRRTWGRLANGSHFELASGMRLPLIRFLFLFGVHNDSAMNAQVQQENLLHGDVIQTDYLEHYDNLTQKTLSGLKWVIDYCPNAKFVMKTDDDIAINIPLMIKVLQQQNFSRHVIGMCYMSPIVFRTKNSIDERLKPNRARFQHWDSWELSCEDYPLAKYPPYTAGHSYVIAGDLVADFFRFSTAVRHFPIEDAYVTGVLRTFAHAQLYCNPGFSSQTYPVPFFGQPHIYEKIITFAYTNVSQAIKFCDGLIAYS